MIEYERKFVLRYSDELKEILETSDRIIGQKIIQIYLDPKGVNRVRKIQTPLSISYTHTFKQSLGKEGMFELEHDITEAEFKIGDRASKDNPRLIKQRFSFDASSKEHWDIDFFLDGTEQVYFVLAEVELQGDVSFSIPDFVSRHMLYKVPYENNSEFSSVKLSNKAYAEEALNFLHGMNPPEDFRMFIDYPY